MADSSWLSRFSGAGNTSPTSKQLYKAFVLLGYDFGYDEMCEGALSYLADFMQRWGKPSLDNLLAIARRFAPGQPRSASDDVEAYGGAALDDVALGGPDTDEEADTTFALAILGVMRPLEAPAGFAPYLTSPYAIERWLAAFGLAAMHDERALPALGRALVEFIGPNQPASRDSPAGYYIQTLRSYLPQVLADWGDPRLAPLVRSALIVTVRAEEIALREPYGPEQEVIVPEGRRFVGWEAWEWFRHTQRQWMEEEHQLVYSLGRLGAFGALAGVPTRPDISYYWEPQTEYIGDETGEVAVAVESSSRNGRVAGSRAAEFRGAIWRVHACCGFLEPQFRDRLEGVIDFADAPEFAEAIERLLAGQFGLDEVERRQAMEDYARTKYLSGTIAAYRRFARQAQEEEAAQEEKQARDERD